MSITPVNGKKFIQLKFTSSTSDTYDMPFEKLIRSVRVTAVAGKFDGYDYITFYEKRGSNPDIFILTPEARATFFHGGLSTILGIKSYKFTNPTEVIVSIEVD